MWYDIVEWDGKIHTVKVERDRFTTDRLITYCDGVTHRVSLEYFYSILVGAHVFQVLNWNGIGHFAQPFFHACGGACGMQ